MSKKTYIILLLFVVFLFTEFMLIKDYLSSKSGSKTDLLPVEILRKKIKNDPLNSKSFYALSRHYKFSNNFNEKKKALFTIKHAVKLAPNNVSYNLELADQLHLSGLHDSALAYYEKSLNIHSNLNPNTVLRVRLAMADIFLKKGKLGLFNNQIALAKSLKPFSWKIDLLLFKKHLFNEELSDAFVHYRSSYKKMFKSSKRDKTAQINFKHKTDQIVASLLRKKKWESISQVYDNYANLTKDAESLLKDLHSRFDKVANIKEMIWGRDISIALFDASKEKDIQLKRSNRGCILSSEKHYLNADDTPAEVIDLTYDNSAGFIDLWHIPLKIPVNSEKSSLRIYLSSDTDIEGNQFALELDRHLLYSKNEVVSKNGPYYILASHNILKYLKSLLPSGLTSNKIFLTKAGLNTACRNGRYSIEKIEMYFE